MKTAVAVQKCHRTRSMDRMKYGIAMVTTSGKHAMKPCCPSAQPGTVMAVASTPQYQCSSCVINTCPRAAHVGDVRGQASAAREHVPT